MLSCSLRARLCVFVSTYYQRIIILSHRRFIALLLSCCYIVALSHRRIVVLLSCCHIVAFSNRRIVRLSYCHIVALSYYHFVDVPKRILSMCQNAFCLCAKTILPVCQDAFCLCANSHFASTQQSIIQFH